MIIINGQFIASSLINNDKKELTKIHHLYKKKLHLVIIYAGNNDISNIYIKKKEEICRNLKINFSLITFPESTNTEEIIIKIRELNNNDDVTAILIQLPLPKQINKWKVLEAIKITKDIDGLTPYHQGLLSYNVKNYIAPCAVSAVIYLLKKYRIKLKGEKILIINDSILIGKPLINLLTNLKATVTVCNKNTVNINPFFNDHKIIITAVGKKNFISHKMIKKEHIIIDLGISRDKKGRIFGDVEKKIYKTKKATLITPVPNGMGPIAIAFLINNMIKLVKQQKFN